MPPIKPSELRKIIPETVFDCFNDLINRNFDGHQAVVRVPDVVALMSKRGFNNRDEAFLNHWLDIEQHYRDAGWDVQYEKPGYNEPGDAYYTFTPKKD